MTARFCSSEGRRALLAQADALTAKFRMRGRKRAAAVPWVRSTVPRRGCCRCCYTISASSGRMSPVQLAEDKTIRLLPRMLSGRLDLAFVRPPERPDKRLEFIVPVSGNRRGRGVDHHPLASRKRVTIADLADQPLIVPSAGRGRTATISP